MYPLDAAATTAEGGMTVAHVKGCSDQNPCFPDGVCHYPLTCKQQKPLTRAELIRQLTDEEMADLITRCFDVVDLGYCQNRQECEEMIKTGTTPTEWCRACLLEWLKAPAKEEGADGSTTV